MRTYVLIFCTLVVIGTAFYFYSRGQTGDPTNVVDQIHHLEPPPATAPTTRSSGPTIHDIDGPWVTMIDAQGRRTSRYRDKESIPRPDGTVHLVAPEADFFLGQNQRLHMTAVSGDVVMRSQSGLSLAGSAGQPTRGRLNDVTMTLIDESGPPRTVITLKTNNIDFDNDSFLITTGGYTAPDGTPVPPDQVPVRVRGDYDFDGRGLTLRWNDQDDRLERLEIAHGEKLVINHPGKNGGSPGVASASNPQSAAGTPPIGSPPVAAPSGPSISSPNAVAAPTPNARPQAAANGLATSNPSPTTKPRRPRPTYLATFDRDVRITQGSDLLMTGDQLRVYFLLKDQQPSPTTAPASPSVSMPIPTETEEIAVRTTARRNICGASASTSSRTDSAESAPANPLGNLGQGLSSDEPVIVRWTGKLVIVPATNAPRPLAPGDSIVELVGVKSQASVLRGATDDSPASQILCTTLTYATADGSISLTGSPQFGLVHIQRQSPPSSDEDALPIPSKVSTPRLDYSGTDHRAILAGPGSASFPTANAEGEAPRVVNAAWGKRATLDFFPRGRGGGLALQSTHFEQDVRIDHPQMNLAAEDLVLSFDAAKEKTGNSTSLLSEAKASDMSGLVDCKLPGAGGKTQEISAHQLDLHMGKSAEGKSLARRLDAAGQVTATDGEQTLTCDRMAALLRPGHAPAGPTTGTAANAVADPSAAPAVFDAGAVELDRLDARGNVRVKSKDGAHTQSDQLLVANDPQGYNVMLTGDSLSKVFDAKGDELSGAQIVLQPKLQIAHVVGAGTIHSLPQPPNPAKHDPGSKEMTTIFNDGADLDGTGNLVTLRGHVQVTMPDSDGSLDTATSDRVLIDLMDKPRSSTQPARGTSAPTGVASENGMMGNKELKKLTLDGNAVIDSTLADAGGIERQSHLAAPLIYYTAVAEAVADADVPAHTLVVPSAGEMLVRDHRPPATQPASGSDDTSLSNGRGATAFAWKKKMLYFEDQRRALLLGDVLVRHLSDNPADPMVTLMADQVSADFVPPAGKHAVPATPSGKAPDPTASGGAMEMKSMEAIGNVSVSRAAEQITGPRLYFEPASHWMTLEGTEDNPVSVTDDQGTHAMYRKVKWNTQSWDFSLQGAQGQGRR